MTYAMPKIHEERIWTVYNQDKKYINGALKWSTFGDMLSRSLQLSEMLLLYGKRFQMQILRNVKFL
jgi:hypothetical protein